MNRELLYERLPDSPLYPRYMVGYPQGWDDLIELLYNTLVKTDPDFQVYQVKEKFGGLRFYTSQLSDEGRKFERLVSRLSYSVCQDCGKAGTLTNIGGWSRTLCDEDAVKYAERNEKAMQEADTYDDWL